MFGTVLDTVRRSLGMGPASYDAIEPPEEGRQYVFDHGHLSAAVESAFLRPGERNGDEFETVAIPPMELIAKVPEQYEEGEKVKIAGPHGPIEVVPPQGAKPGSEFTFRLIPAYEFRVEVPPGAKPGLQIEVKRRDGVKVAINVPPQLKPGDIFEVLPPALIARVPDGAKAGDLVVFRPAAPPDQKIDPQVAQLWIRSRVPEGAVPGNYFAARLPVPQDSPKHGGSMPGSEAEAKEPASSMDKEGAEPLLGPEAPGASGIGA